MKNKSEIQIVNEKVSDAIKSLTQKKKKQDEIIESIQRNQGHFYHWQNIEKLINCNSIRTDEAAFNYLKSNFNEGVLRDFLKKFMPIVKENFKTTIDKQIEALKK